MDPFVGRGASAWRREADVIEEDIEVRELGLLNNIF
jgi:hypothetical protein